MISVDLESGLCMCAVRGCLGELKGYMDGCVVFQEGADSYFWNLGRNSPVLGRGSRKGSR